MCLFAALAGAASAQMKMSVEQLVTFVKSSVQLKEDDRKVAEMVKKIQLSNQLDAKTIESLQELGAGRLTVAALKTLRTDSASLPAAPAPVVAAKVTAAPIPAPDAETQQKVLAAITQDAVSYSEGLPNFICMQVTRRYVAQNGSDNFRLTDTIAERLSYFEHKEDYKVISVNGTPVRIVSTSSWRCHIKRRVRQYVVRDFQSGEPHRVSMGAVGEAAGSRDARV